MILGVISDAHGNVEAFNKGISLLVSEGAEIGLSGSMTNSRWCYDHALALPLFDEMTFEQQEIVVNELKKLV